MLRWKRGAGLRFVLAVEGGVGGKPFAFDVLASNLHKGDVWALNIFQQMLRWRSQQRYHRRMSLRRSWQ